MAKPAYQVPPPPVTTRTLSWLDLCMRSWGSEFRAPDHGIYEFTNGRKFDSTDQTNNGFYGTGNRNA